jgi:hypothetical protein
VRLEELEEAHPEAAVELLGRGRGTLGPQASDKASVGTGGKEARYPLQERLQVDLSLRFRAP